MQKKSLIKQNILQFIEYKGISKYKFYSQTGITRGVLDQNNGMSEENTAKFLAQYPEISPEWLLTGNGSMLKDFTVSTVAPTPSDEQDKHKLIPLVYPSAATGFGSASFSITQEDVKEYYVVPKFKYCKIDFMIEVSGSSMYPKYNSGDIIACTVLRSSEFIQWNKCHLIATREQGLLVKRLRKSQTPNCLLAVSDNPSYDPFDIPEQEILGIALIVGVVRLE